MTSADKQPVDAKVGKAPVPKTAERRRLSLFRAAPSRKPPVVAEFQSDAIEGEERTPPRIARLTLYCVVALILAAVG